MPEWAYARASKICFDLGAKRAGLRAVEVFDIGRSPIREMKHRQGLPLNYIDYIDPSYLSL